MLFVAPFLRVATERCGNATSCQANEPSLLFCTILNIDRVLSQMASQHYIYSTVNKSLSDYELNIFTKNNNKCTFSACGIMHGSKALNNRMICTTCVVWWISIVSKFEIGHYSSQGLIRLRFVHANDYHNVYMYCSCIHKSRFCFQFEMHDGILWLDDCCIDVLLYII